MSIGSDKLGDALDTLLDVRWHIELMDMATRHSPDDDAKALSAVIHTILTKLAEARGDLEDLWRYQKEAQE